MAREGSVKSDETISGEIVDPDGTVRPARIGELTRRSAFVRGPRLLRFGEPLRLRFAGVSVEAEVVHVSPERPTSGVVLFETSETIGRRIQALLEGPKRQAIRRDLQSVVGVPDLTPEVPTSAGADPEPRTESRAPALEDRDRTVSSARLPNADRTTIGPPLGDAGAEATSEDDGLLDAPTIAPDLLAAVALDEAAEPDPAPADGDDTPSIDSAVALDSADLVDVVEVREEDTGPLDPPLGRVALASSDDAFDDWVEADVEKTLPESARARGAIAGPGGLDRDVLLDPLVTPLGAPRDRPLGVRPSWDDLDLEAEPLPVLDPLHLVEAISSIEVAASAGPRQDDTPLSPPAVPGPEPRSADALARAMSAFVVVPEVRDGTEDVDPLTPEPFAPWTSPGYALDPASHDGMPAAGPGLALSGLADDLVIASPEPPRAGGSADHVQAEPVQEPEAHPRAEPRLPSLEGAELVFDSAADFVEQYGSTIAHGGLVVRSAPLPIGAQRVMRVRVPGVTEVIDVSGRVGFLGAGSVGFMIDSFALVRERLAALARRLG